MSEVNIKCYRCGRYVVRGEPGTRIRCIYNCDIPRQDGVLMEPYDGV